MKIDYWAKFEYNQYYHIYNRGVDGVNLFYNAKNYRYFLEKWLHYTYPFLKTYAYCLMPNHFHFIVSPNLDIFNNLDKEKYADNIVLSNRIQAVQDNLMSINDFLELQFKDYFGAYSKAINKQEKRTGSLFQQRFKRVFLKDEYALAEKICYTHHNPIHHGFCEQYNDWIYSSYHRFFSERPTILERKIVLDLFHRIAQVNNSKVTDIQITDTSKVSVTSQITSLNSIHENYRQKPMTNYDEI